MFCHALPVYYNACQHVSLHPKRPLLREARAAQRADVNGKTDKSAAPKHSAAKGKAKGKAAPARKRSAKNAEEEVEDPESEPQPKRKAKKQK